MRHQIRGFVSPSVASRGLRRFAHTTTAASAAASPPASNVQLEGAYEKLAGAQVGVCGVVA
jgi:hypothetical protein